jgi:hypothetical protein
MLSFSKGRPIARIEGGVLDGELLQIDDGSKSYNVKECVGCGCDCDDCNSQDCNEDEACCDYCKFLNIEEDEFEEEPEIGKELELPNGEIIPVPNIDTREVVFIGGPSGSGKSTMAAKYIEGYKQAFPGKPVIVFSRKPEDNVLDRLKPLRFIIDETIVTEPVDIIKDLKGGACILFDDCNTIQDDKVKHAVSKLMNDVLEIGRSDNIYCIVTSHLLNPNEKKDSRTIWNEAHTITIFPKSGNRHAMVYSLEKYCGIDKKAINAILDLPSRWVMIGKQYPMYILHEKGAKLL